MSSHMRSRGRKTRGVVHQVLVGFNILLQSQRLSPSHCQRFAREDNWPQSPISLSDVPAGRKNLTAGASVWRRQSSSPLPRKGLPRMNKPTAHPTACHAHDYPQPAAWIEITSAAPSTTDAKIVGAGFASARAAPLSHPCGSRTTNARRVTIRGASAWSLRSARPTRGTTPES